MYRKQEFSDFWEFRNVLMAKSNSLSLISAALLPEFKEQLPLIDWPEYAKNFPKISFTSDSFSFYASVSSVYSSKIEGEDIDLNSFLNHKFFNGSYQPDYTRKIDDLFEAYIFAKDQVLKPANLLKAHATLTKHILRSSGRGKIRSKQEFIINSQGQMEYVAADAGIVALEMEKFFKDLKVLVKTKLSLAETLYYAAMLHLVLLKIHPFEDGNGRMARLLEKWFLASQLGPEAWNIPSEQYYYQNLSAYYRNVHIGFDYETVDYQRSLPFLLMLPQAIQHQS